jgi:hypothetical protein
MLDLAIHQIAAALGGQVTGVDTCNVPGPKHSPGDRSLSIRITHAGFVIYSFANDNWKVCREYERGKSANPDSDGPNPATIKLPPNTSVKGGPHHG